jgi:hypothetical protein
MISDTLTYPTSEAFRGKSIVASFPSFEELNFTNRMEESNCISLVVLVI